MLLGIKLLLYLQNQLIHIAYEKNYNRYNSIVCSRHMLC